jgi:hypothetical protein
MYAVVAYWILVICALFGLSQGGNKYVKRIDQDEKQVN